jgi:hypothetical protein
MHKKLVLDLIESILNWMTSLAMLPVLILLSVITLAVGVLLILKPSLAIEIQRRFYEKINWRIEPISMQKEIRNTRLMGWFIICFLALILSLQNLIAMLK